MTFNLPSSTTTSNTNTVRNAIIGSLVSGVMGLGFFGFQIWLKRKAQQRFEKAASESEGVGKQQAEFHQNVIRPIAKSILARIQVTGFMGYVSDQTMHDALSVISGLVHELEQQGVDVDLQSLSSVQQRRLLDTIARQTRRILVPDSVCCSPSRFFCPEVTPNQIEDKIPAIAAAVKKALQQGEAASMRRESKELKNVETSSRIASPSGVENLESGVEMTGVSPLRFFSQSISTLESRVAILETTISQMKRATGNDLKTYRKNRGNQIIADRLITRRPKRMTLLELFCLVDDFYPVFLSEWQRLLLTSGVRKRRRKMGTSYSEIITLLLWVQQSRYRDFKNFYICEVLNGTLRTDFPRAVSYTRFVSLIDEC